MKRHTLAELKKNETCEIIAFSGGKLAVKRLADLGLTPGTRIKIIRKALGAGPLQIEIHNAKLIIGKGLATKIIIHKISDV